MNVKLKMDLQKDMENIIYLMDFLYIIIQIMIDMKENLMMIKEKVMAYITIHMRIDMKANQKMIMKMDMELIVSLMEINMK